MAGLQVAGALLAPFKETSQLARATGWGNILRVLGRA
jgi:hypothetical protein